MRENIVLLKLIKGLVALKSKSDYILTERRLWPSNFLSRIRWYQFQKQTGFSYSRVRNKRTPTFIDFCHFLQGLQSYYGLKRLKFYCISLHILRGYIYYFCQIFQRLRLFKRLCLFQTLEYVEKVSTMKIRYLF